MAQRWLAVLICVLALTLATNAAALTLPGVPTASVEQDPDEPIRVGADASDDAAIAARLQEVFEQLPNLERAEISVNAGVVRLSGAAPTAAAIAQAEDIARRVDGVVAVRNEIEAEADVAMRLRPAVETLEQRLRALIAAAPLILLALAVVAISILLAWLLGRWKRLWRKKGRSGFIGDLATRTIQFIVVGVGVVLALVVLDATALLTATLGAAGLLGLAVGFALRDMIENTIASILLSLRQPFRPRDLVLINDYEGFVVRLTSRATILLTLDGNHVRIPNSDVFKATIVNYTRNPERRLTVELGLAVENDPIAAIEAGALALKELDFVLEEPPPGGRVVNVGESNVVIELWAWMDQRTHDFLRSRSVAIAHAKHSLEAQNFALPEPIYRLRFDTPPPEQVAAPAPPVPPRPAPTPAAPTHSTLNDPSLVRFVDQERREQSEGDLLSDDGPTE